MFQVSHRRLCLQESNTFLLFFVQFPDFFKMIVSSPLKYMFSDVYKFPYFLSELFLIPPGSLPIHVSRATYVRGRSFKFYPLTHDHIQTHTLIHIHTLMGYCV